MRLTYADPSLLDKRLDEDVMPEALESFWHDHVQPIAVRMYRSIGVTKRLPFVLDENTNPPDIHHQSSLILRKMTEQVPGRTTMVTYAPHVLRFLITLIDDGKDFTEIDANYLSQYRARRLATETPTGGELSHISWNSEAAALKTMFDAAVIAGLRSDNPAQSPILRWKVKGASVAPPEPKFVTLEKFRKFRDDGLMQTRSPLRNAAFAEMLLTSGMRLYEGAMVPALAMPKKIDAKGGRAFTYAVPAPDGKGHRARNVPVGIPAYDRVMAYEHFERGPKLEKMGVDKQTALWINQSGDQMGIHGWEKVFENASDKSGVKITPHTLRHTFAIYMLCALLRRFHEARKINDEVRSLSEGGRGDVYQTIFGDPLRALQRLLGHKSYETTLVYLDVLSADDTIIDEAMEIFQDALGSEESYHDLVR